MITLKEAQTKLTAADAIALTAGEKRIDEALAKFDGHAINVDFSNTNTSRKVLDKLVQMYEAGGWLVRIESGDQRDPGPWLNFRAP